MTSSPGSPMSVISVVGCFCSEFSMLGILVFACAGEKSATLGTV